MSINTPGVLDSELQIEMYLTDVKNESLPDEVFDRLGADYIYTEGEDPAPIPNSIYLRLDAKADEARKVKVPMVKDLSEAPTLGAAGDQRGSEEDITSKHFETEYTDVSHATTNQKYGIYARDKFPYKLFEQRVPLLGRYFKQYFGKMRRQTLLERHSENLEEAPHFLTSAFSPNWFVTNRTERQQPTFSATGQTHVNNIVEALQGAGVGESAAISVRFVQRAERWARSTAFLEPIDFEDGTDGYIFLIPDTQALWLKHPSNAAAMGGIWRDVLAFPKETREMYPRMAGQIGGMRIIADQRYPTLTIGGSGSVDGSYTLTAQYRGMGRADDGSSDPRDFSSVAREVGFIIGKAAIVEWTPEGFHWEWEYSQYDKYFGSGIFLSCGMKQPIYHTGTTLTDSNWQQDSSAVVAFAPPPDV